MRVFCPSCQEPVTIADDLAGKATFCPLCKAAFTAPTLFSPPPAPLTPPSPAQAPPNYPNLSLEPAPAPPAPPTPSPDGPTTKAPDADQPPKPIAAPGSIKMVGFTIPVEVVHWLAPAFLILAVFLSFFSWNGAYPGGYDAYTQGPWRAIAGSYDFDPVAEDVLHLNDQAADGVRGLKDSVSYNLLMFPYVFLLVASAGVAVVLTLLPRLKLKIPPQAQPLVPYRMALVAGLGLLLMLILGFQSLRGFGLENAIYDRVDKSLQSEREKAKLPDDVKKFEIRRDQIIGGLNVRHTTAVKLEMFCLILTVAGAGLAFALARRGDRGLRVDLTV